MSDTPETPETSVEQTGIMTVGDMLEILKTYPPELEFRIVMIDEDTAEGKIDQDDYPVMYLDSFVDDDPESETHGQTFVAAVSDFRDGEVGEGDEGEAGDDDADFAGD